MYRYCITNFRCKNIHNIININYYYTRIPVNLSKTISRLTGSSSGATRGLLKQSIRFTRLSFRRSYAANESRLRETIISAIPCRLTILLNDRSNNLGLDYRQSCSGNKDFFLAYCQSCSSNKREQNSYCQSRNGLMVMCMRVRWAIFLANTYRHSNCFTYS